MFTGLIDNIGIVESIVSSSEGKLLRIETEYEDPIETGESIAVNGVCLSVTSKNAIGFSADISPETIKRTTIGGLKRGDRVNLERALRAFNRLGGHFVQGHVDCTGRIFAVRKTGRFWNLSISYPREFDRFLVQKGSVAIDGVSLTIARLKNGKLEIALIPETLSKTTFDRFRKGIKVNIEFDIIAKYIDKMMYKK